MKTLRLLAAVVFAIGPSGAMFTALPMSPALAAESAVPAECATKTRIVPRTPGWVFVVNFDTFVSAGKPKGCLMLYRVVYAPTDFVPVTCESVGVVPVYSAGKALFNGGSVRCDLNVKQTLASLTPPAVVTDTVAFPYFTIVASGVLSNHFVLNLYANPLGVYQPTVAPTQTLGLYAPLIVEQTSMVHSEFNGITNTTSIRLGTGVPYTFTVEHDGGPDVFTSTHYLNDKMIGQYSPRNPVLFHTNGGTFWIGADPIFNTTFYGTLDEVIFDPPDGGRPPTYAHDQYLVFTPMTLR